MPIYLYILKRVLVAIPTILIVSIISFTIMRYDFTFGPIRLPMGAHGVTLMPQVHWKNPIDPLAELRANPQISRAAYEHEKQRLGLDKPFYMQYWLWLSHIFQFHPKALLKGRLDQFFTPDLGKSFSGEDVTRILMSRIPNTLLLNVVTIIACWTIALPLGIFAALHWRKPADSALTLLSSVGMAAPSFVVAILLGVWPLRHIGCPLVASPAIISMCSTPSKKSAMWQHTWSCRSLFSPFQASPACSAKCEGIH